MIKKKNNLNQKRLIKKRKRSQEVLVLALKKVNQANQISQENQANQVNQKVNQANKINKVNQNQIKIRVIYKKYIVTCFKIRKRRSQ